MAPGSGPRLVASIRIRISSGPALAYSIEYVKVAVVVEDAGVNQFELKLALAAPAILLDQPVIGEFPLRVLVKKLHVGMRRRRVEIVVIFLDVFAVIAFVAGEAEQPFFEDRVFAVPQRQRETNKLVAIADAAKAVLAPAVRTTARVVVGEIFPSRAGGAVVFPYRAPLTLGKVRPPAFPVGFAAAIFLQSLLFGCHRSFGQASFLFIGHYNTSCTGNLPTLAAARGNSRASRRAGL